MKPHLHITSSNILCNIAYQNESESQCSSTAYHATITVSSTIFTAPATNQQPSPLLILNVFRICTSLHKYLFQQQQLKLNPSPCEIPKLGLEPASKQKYKRIPVRTSFDSNSALLLCVDSFSLSLRLSRIIEESKTCRSQWSWSGPGRKPNVDLRKYKVWIWEGEIYLCTYKKCTYSYYEKGEISFGICRSKQIWRWCWCWCECCCSREYGKSKSFPYYIHTRIIRTFFSSLFHE